MVSLLMEETSLPLSKLVDEIFLKLKAKIEVVTIVSVGQRVSCGVLRSVFRDYHCSSEEKLSSAHNIATTHQLSFLSNGGSKDQIATLMEHGLCNLAEMLHLYKQALHHYTRISVRSVEELSTAQTLTRSQKELRPNKFFQSQPPTLKKIETQTPLTTNRCKTVSASGFCFQCCE